MSATRLGQRLCLCHGGFPLDKAQEYVIIMTGVANMAAAMRAEYKSKVISPDFRRMN